MSQPILTTHAGSLPRPADLLEMWRRRNDGEEIDMEAFEARVDSAVSEIVARQRAAGVDVVSDGELSKTGFHTYVVERFSGFDGTSEFQTDDLAEFPNLTRRLFNTPSIAHASFSNCVGPVELLDKDAARRDVERLIRTLDGAQPAGAFLGAVSPGEITFAFPDQYYGSEEAYLSAVGQAISHEYRAITDAGLNLQIDSPDMAMGAHTRMIGASRGVDWHEHMPLAVEALNAALDGIPPERVRLHVCWGNYPGPHHHDIPLRDVIDQVLQANVGTIYIEGANPRHEHEWRVFEDVQLPADRSIILGVIDVKSNCVEHPRVVADRLVRLGKLIGPERLVAGTDCGFDTLGGSSPVDPDVVWLKLQALSDGAELAAREL